VKKLWLRVAAELLIELYESWQTTLCPRQILLLVSMPVSTFLKQEKNNGSNGTALQFDAGQGQSVALKALVNSNSGLHPIRSESNLARDGNLILMQEGGAPYWASPTRRFAPQPTAFEMVSLDGRLITCFAEIDAVIHFSLSRAEILWCRRWR
jgi:hypothetical protein